MNSRTSRAASGTFTAFIQYGLHLIFQVALAPIVLKVAGKETLGAYAVIIQIVGQLALFDFGFTTTIMRYLSNAYGFDDNKKRFTNVFTTGRSFLLGSNFLIFIIVFVLSFKIGDILSLSSTINIQAKYSLVFLSFWILVRTPILLYDGALFATQNQKTSNVFNIISICLRILLSLSLVYLGFGLVGLMLANVASELIRFVLSRRYFRKIYPKISFSWGFPDKLLFKEMFKFGFQVLILNITARLIYGADNIIAGSLFGASKTAVFYTTQIPTFAAFVLIWKLADNAAPAINELVAKNNVESLKNGYLRLYRYSSLVSFPAALGIIIFNKPLVSLWVGKTQYAGDIMSYALAVFLIHSVISHINAICLIAFGSIRPLIIYGLLEAILKISLSFILGRNFGFQWVMVASAIAAIPGFFIISLITLHQFHITIKQFWIETIKPTIVSCFFPGIVFLLILIFQPIISPINFISSVSIYLLSVLIGILFFGLSAFERKQITFYFRGLPKFIFAKK